MCCDFIVIPGVMRGFARGRKEARGSKQQLGRRNLAMERPEEGKHEIVFFCRCEYGGKEKSAATRKGWGVRDLSRPTAGQDLEW